MTPLVSVVIPAFNRRLELARALESLASQTCQDFEIIVCDDGSTEDLKSTVLAFSGKVDIRYIRIDNSGGPARPRNTAVGMARGLWIAFLDSDDWWDSHRIERIRPHLEAGVDLVYHPLRVVSARNLKGRRERRAVIGEAIGADALDHMALLGNPIPNSAAIVRRSALDHIGGICEDRDIVALEDFDAWMRLVENGFAVRFVPEVLGAYWVGEDGISKVTDRHVQRQIVLYNRHAAKFRPEIRSLAESRQDYVLGTMLMRLAGHRRAARSHLLRARELPTRRLQFKRLLKIALTFLP